MKRKHIQYIPLAVTVGQVVIFPYYIIWLKQVSLTFTLFAWFFAAFSFAAAWGYQLQQSKQQAGRISFIYIGMGAVYLTAGMLDRPFGSLPGIVLLLQILLGLLQGYFRAWHAKQDTYHLHAVHHYMMVGAAMIGFSFVKVVSPGLFIGLFGGLLFCCGAWQFVQEIYGKARQKDADQR